MSLSQRATCRVLSGHRESTSLFEAAKGAGRKGGGRKGGRKDGCRRSEAGKVVEKRAAAEIVGKGKRRKEEDIQEKKREERMRGSQGGRAL